MKDQIRKINQLVADGALTADEAADLIEALMQGERTETERVAPDAGTPPPPPDAPKPPVDQISGFFQDLERMAREKTESIDWADLGRKMNEGAKRGRDIVRETIDDISKGSVNLGWLGTSEHKSIDLPLMVPTGKVLRIENPIGDIHIHGGKEIGNVRAEASIRGASLDDAKAKADQYTLTIEESEHAVVIKQPDMTGLNVDLHIDLNGFAAIEVRAESGDIHIHETGAGVRINSRSGDIHLSGLNGAIEVSSDSGNVHVSNVTATILNIEHKSGDVSLENIRGNVSARTASGDVSAKRLESKVISLETVSGDIAVSLINAVSGTVNIRTVSGDATIEIPANSDSRVSISTLNGEVAFSGELSEEHRTAQRITGRIGEGTGVLDISAVTGDIAVHVSLP
jgi:DUF4097 and DUF4098 domain-containing protein YvlB/polyhydroxyalkanoate synthesis regulator phasin